MKGEKRKECRLLVGKPEGKRLPASTRHRWVDWLWNCGMDWSGSG
jgi:hypothetical protein